MNTTAFLHRVVFNVLLNLLTIPSHSEWYAVRFGISGTSSDWLPSGPIAMCHTRTMFIMDIQTEAVLLPLAPVDPSDVDYYREEVNLFLSSARK